MSPEKTDRLYERFAHLYRGKTKPPTDSLMAYGFICDDGWFDLIWQLSARLEDIALQEGRARETEEWPEALQVKEKLGSLRFYLRNSSPAMQCAINEASERSTNTCERCGSPDARLAGGRTLCALHA